ncbi:MAG: hypothetical protein Q8S73_09795 [Deltaproteobacteria bacterium]|nr:hypothetical protein [Myxococcales bacterium]MDP3214385.1 hypothetical protein [Deltaproteobacteria bacterium]
MKRSPVTAALALAAALLGGCSLGLDFSPAILLPSLDAGSSDLGADAVTHDAPAPDVRCAASPCPCAAGRGDCDDRASNGCETDLLTETEHCGACGRDCEGAESCVGGECVRARCRAPEVECGAVCADLRDDSRHCGACGSACGSGASRCCGGVCIDAPRCP